jgi:ABC-type polysaccharide/polyol phosphate export permease
MAFFSGTFFPVDQMPDFIKWIIYLLPLTHANIAIRKEVLDWQGAFSLMVMIACSVAFFLYGSARIKKYSE